MKIQYFSPPDGELVDDPDLAWLQELVLAHGSEYWNAGAGQASLTRIADGQTTEMLLTFHSDWGFYIEYISPDSIYYVSLGPGELNAVVDVYVGGNPIRLSKRFFVSKHDTLSAIEEFFKSGLMTPQLVWAERSKLAWDYGTP